MMCPGEGFLNDNLASPAVIPVPCGCEAVSLDEIPVDVHRCHLMCCEQRAPWSEGYDWMPHTILTPKSCQSILLLFSVHVVNALTAQRESKTVLCTQITLWVISLLVA